MNTPVNTCLISLYSDPCIRTEITLWAAGILTFRMTSLLTSHSHTLLRSLNPNLNSSFQPDFFFDNFRPCVCYCYLFSSSFSVSINLFCLLLISNVCLLSTLLLSDKQGTSRVPDSSSLSLYSVDMHLCTYFIFFFTF